MTKLKKIIVTLLLTCLLSSCMGIKFTYNNLDWFIPWYLDDYLILDDQQEEVFDHHLEALLKWHRHHELPQYSKLLQQIITDLDKQQITHERLNDYVEQSNLFYQKIIIKSLEQGGQLLADLNDEQLEDMMQTIAESDQEFEEYVKETSFDKRENKRRKSVTKTFRKWLGRLSKSQKQRIRQWSKEVETTLEYRLDYTGQVRIAFRKIIANRKDLLITKQSLTELVTRPELLMSQQHYQTVERNRLRFRQLLVDMANTLSPKQQARLLKKINRYAKDFMTLSAQDL